MLVNVLIISDESDLSTNEVIEWLLFFNVKFVRINKQDSIIFDEIKLNNKTFDFYFYLNGKRYNLSSFSSVWYRRGRVDFSKFFNFENIKDENLVKYYKDELYALNILFIEYISKLKKIGDFKNNILSKIDILTVAKKVRFNIPETRINTNNFFLKEIDNLDYITKAINTGISIEYKNHKYDGFTSLIKKKHFNNYFFPTLTQSRIDKFCELRVFYLNKKSYAMAIFSQNDKQTMIDFRIYNEKKQNRTVPFKLPKNIEKKIINLMENLNMNTGSIDIILTKEFKYVFLEVNPVGQFKQVSYPCNYNLEKKICQELMK